MYAMTCSTIKVHGLGSIIRTHGSIHNLPTGSVMVDFAAAVSVMVDFAATQQ
jgi:hypothetical protein